MKRECNTVKPLGSSPFSMVKSCMDFTPSSCPVGYQVRDPPIYPIYPIGEMSSAQHRIVSCSSRAVHLDRWLHLVWKKTGIFFAQLLVCSTFSSADGRKIVSPLPPGTQGMKTRLIIVFMILHYEERLEQPYLSSSRHNGKHPLATGLTCPNRELQRKLSEPFPTKRIRNLTSRSIFRNFWGILLLYWVVRLERKRSSKTFQIFKLSLECCTNSNKL